MTGYLEDVKVLTENLNRDNITKPLEDKTFQNVVLPLGVNFFIVYEMTKGSYQPSGCLMLTRLKMSCWHYYVLIMKETGICICLLYVQ